MKSHQPLPLETHPGARTSDPDEGRISQLTDVGFRSYTEKVCNHSCSLNSERYGWPSSTTINKFVKYLEQTASY
jgi:hypothetical protein